MIGPRRSPTTGEHDLVPALLGLAALRERIRALVRELAADGDGAAEGGEIAEADLLDLLLGLAQLAESLELPVDPPAPAPPEDAGGAAAATAPDGLLR
jgi:hypothetical protein